MGSSDPGQTMSLDGEVADVCRRLMPDFEPVSIAPAAAETSACRSVYQVEDRKGTQRLLKLFLDDDRRGADGDALATEAAALRQLHGLGCPVPELIASDAAVGATATEWLPGDTLESRLQSGTIGPEGRRAVVRALIAVDLAFRGLTKMQAGNRRERVTKELQSRLREDILELKVGPPWFVRPGHTDRWNRALDDAIELLTIGEWSHGSLDCSASNIVLANGRAYIIDLSILGAEWRERRAVRYGIATGSGRNGCEYMTLFDSATASFYSDMAGAAESGDEIAVQLDLHHLLLLLRALDRTGDVNPTGRSAAGGGTHGRGTVRGGDRELLAIVHRPLGPGQVGDSLRACLTSPHLTSPGIQ